MKSAATLKNLDVFGSSIQFNYKGETTLKTQLGGFVTIIAFVIFLGLLQYFGMELFEKKSPIVNITSFQRNISEITFKEYNPIVFFSTPAGQFVPADEAEKYLTIKVNNYYIKPVDGKTSINVLSTTKINKCYEVEELSKAQKLVSANIPSNVPFCFNFGNNTSFYNDYGFTTSSFYNIRVYVCNEKRDGKQCASKEVINKVLSEYYISISLANSIIDPLNYTNPGTVSKTTLTEKFDNKFLRRTYFNIYKIDVKTDDGIFSEEFKTDTYINYEHLKSDIGTIPTAESDELFRFNFESRRASQLYIRSYLKVTEVLSKVGGFLNLIMVFCETLCTYVSKKSLVLQQAKDEVDFQEIESNSGQEGKKSDIPNTSSTELNIIKITNDKRGSPNEFFNPKSNDVIFINAYKQEETKTQPIQKTPKTSNILTELKKREPNEKLTVQNIGFKDYFNSSFCCKSKGSSNKEFYTALFNHFDKKLSILNVTRSCYHLQLLKKVLFSSIDNYEKLFDIKEPIEEILLNFENAEKSELELAAEDRLKETENITKRKAIYEKEEANLNSFISLAEIQENFARKNLFR